MATNQPASQPDIKRITVPAATEVAFVFEGKVTLLDFRIQTIESVNLLIGLTEDSTFSSDNFYTLKSGHVLHYQDINWSLPENALWFRSASGEITVEVWYW